MNPEQFSEKILTKTEVIEILSRFVEGATEVRELSDDQGLYMFEVEKPGDLPGERTQYIYMRKGEFPNGIATLETHIDVVYMEGDDVVGGNSVARISENGEWEKLA